MGKSKKFVESDDEPLEDSEDFEPEDDSEYDEDEEERIPVQRQPMKVSARPRRAAAVSIAKK